MMKLTYRDLILLLIIVALFLPFFLSQSLYEAYHACNAAVLMFFMIFSAFIPQDFCAVVVPLALALLLRSCSYVVSYCEK